MENFEKNWKEKMDDPRSFQGYIPAETKHRIAHKVLPKQSIRRLPLWFSHAAALVIGMILTGLGFYFWNTNTKEMINPDTIVQTRVDTIIKEVAMVATAPSPKLDRTTKPTGIKKTHSSITTNEKSPLRKSLNGAIKNKQYVNNNIDKPLYSEQNPDPASSNDPLPIASTKSTRRTLSVSDIAPSYHATSFTEKVTQPMMANQQKKTEKSPFKFINKYQ